MNLKPCTYDPRRPRRSGHHLGCGLVQCPFLIPGPLTLLYSISLLLLATICSNLSTASLLTIFSVNHPEHPDNVHPRLTLTLQANHP